MSDAALQARQLSDVDAAREVLATPGGRLFARRLIFNWADVLGQTMGHPEGLTQEQRAGQRDVGIAAMNLFREADPAAFSRLVAEQDAEIAAAEAISKSMAARRAAEAE